MALAVTMFNAFKIQDVGKKGVFRFTLPKWQFCSAFLQNLINGRALVLQWRKARCDITVVSRCTVQRGELGK